MHLAEVVETPAVLEALDPYLDEFEAGRGEQADHLLRRVQQLVPSGPGRYGISGPEHVQLRVPHAGCLDLWVFRPRNSPANPAGMEHPAHFSQGNDGVIKVKEHK